MENSNAPAPAANPGVATEPAAMSSPSGKSSEASGNPVKEAAAEAARKLKIKNDAGAEEEVDEAEVLKIYKERRGHQRAANKELQEGRAAKKQAEEFISMMKDKGKLFEAIQKLGHDPRKLSEEYLASQLEDDMLDPKDKELRETRKKLSTYEEKEKQAAEAEKKAQDEKIRAKFADDYSKDFVEALKSTDLPPTKVMVGQMAGYVARAAKIGMQMTALEAAKLVGQDEDSRIEHRFKNATPEQIMKILKEEGLQKVRTFDTARLKDPNSHLKTPTEQGEPGKKREQTKRMTPQEWRKFSRGY